MPGAPEGRTERLSILKHLDDLSDLVDRNLFAVSIDQRISPAVKSKVEEMLTLGVPMAVFLAPPGTHL